MQFCHLFGGVHAFSTGRDLLRSPVFIEIRPKTMLRLDQMRVIDAHQDTQKPADPSG